MRRAVLISPIAAMLSVIAVLRPVQAEDPWFDAGIGGYSGWPDDGTDLVVEGAGTWRGTGNAELVVEADARSLQIASRTDQEALGFAIAAPRSVDSEIVTIRTTVLMPPLTEGEEMALPPADVKCAIVCGLVDEETLVYFGMARDPAGETNAWRRLSGVSPDRDAEAEIGFDLKVDNGVEFVRYSVNGKALAADGSEWLEVFVPDGGGVKFVSGVAYCGGGRIDELAGFTENAIPRAALTIPAIEGVKITSVKANGVVVEAQDGVYWIPRGAVVVVRFDPEDAFHALTSSSLSFVMDTEDRALSGDELPSAIGVSSYVTINEIMASNGLTLATRNGRKGLDWVELHNSADSEVDLAGWYLGNDPGKKASKWGDFRIRGRCVIPAHGYKIVWCDGDNLCADDDFAADEAYVRCNISTTAGKHTVFVSSSGSADGIVQKIEMPGQMKDVSYGLGKLERTLLGANDAAEYRVGGGAWTSVRGPVGLSSAETSFTVTSYKSNVDISTVDEAEALLSDGLKWNGDPVKTVGVRSIAFRSDSGIGDFDASDYAFFPVGPGNLVMVVEGTVTIPRTGLWTFSVGSDDGFRLTLSDVRNSYVVEHTNARGYAQTYSAFSMEAGSYDLRLVYFDKSGSAAVDVSVAEGDRTVGEGEGFKVGSFILVGAEKCPVQHGGALAGHLAADLGPEMLGKTDTFEWRSTFGLDERPDANDRVRLEMRYADGFTARLNGMKIAEVKADAARPAVDALTGVSFEIDNELLVRGENTLEIAVVNDGKDNPEAFLSAQVVMEPADGALVYFREPTPGRANTARGYGPMTPKVRFSEPHGYKTDSFELALTCADAPHAPIRYTLDGTSPTGHSKLYVGPITVSNTACIRAAVPMDNPVLQYDCAATYIFLEDVLENQRPGVVPEGFPADREVNNHAMRYGMSPKAMNADPERLRRGFGNISTLSVVVDPRDLFDRASGIYVNPSGDGKAWERKVMLEQINPGGDEGFSVPAGIRIRGGASRSVGCAKHSFRFFFRGEYGMGALEYPLFGDEGAAKFDKVDLRTSQNYSWANEGSDGDTFIHECFSRDSQGAMGQYYTRSRYYHLFINGQYWGLYQTQERGDKDFAETYNGGAAANYDVIKTSMPGYRTGVDEGTEDAWSALWDLAVNQGFGEGHESNYMRALGRDPDGTRNPDCPVLLNPENLMVYMLTAHFTCDSDSPTSVWNAYPNNLYCLRDRVDGDSRADGFFFLRHDAEHSMGLRNESRADADPTNYGTEDINAGFSSYDKFNPAELHWRLCENAEYRRAFADLFHQHCISSGGALTAPVAKARFTKRMAEIDDAVVAEAARWSKDPDSPKSRSTWMAACNGRLDFIDRRLAHMKSQYRDRGWYPRTEAAMAVDSLGQPLADGATVGVKSRFYLSNPSDGTVYYTTDGSDPMQADGAPGRTAVEYTGGSPVTTDVEAFGRGSVWRCYQAGDCPAVNWSALDYDDSDWAEGNGRFGFANSGTFGMTLERYAGGGLSGTQVTTYYFRKSFDLPKEAGALATLKVTLDCDDAFAIYLNGVEVRRENLPSGSVSYETFASAAKELRGEYVLSFGAGLLKAGSNVIAVEVHQCNASSSDAWWDCALAYPKAGDAAGGLAVPEAGVTLTTRVLSSDGREWSARDTITLMGGMPESSYPEVVAEMSETNEAIRAWIEGLCETEEGRMAVEGFAGTAEALWDCYLVDIAPESEPEIALRIPSVSFTADGKVVIGGDLLLNGVRQDEKTVNGMIRLYHSTVLDALPMTQKPIDLGHAFPIPESRGIVELEVAPAQFFRLKIE